MMKPAFLEKAGFIMSGDKKVFALLSLIDSGIERRSKIVRKNIHEKICRNGKGHYLCIRNQEQVLPGCRQYSRQFFVC